MSWAIKLNMKGITIRKTRGLGLEDRFVEVFGERLYNLSQVTAMLNYLCPHGNYREEDVRNYVEENGLFVDLQMASPVYSGINLLTKEWVRKSELVGVAKGMELKTTIRDFERAAKFLSYKT